MPKILMIHGSNMNLLGIRQPEIYGTTSAAELDKMLVEYAQKKKFDLEIFSTNSEGECIDRIIKAHFDKVDVLVMNPGGFTYAAHSIRDTIKGVKIPYVEVHLSNHYERGLHSVVAPAAQGVIMGLGLQVYFAGMDAAPHLAVTRENNHSWYRHNIGDFHGGGKNLRFRWFCNPILLDFTNPARDHSERKYLKRQVRGTDISPDNGEGFFP